jgi:hypothetical protein
MRALYGLAIVAACLAAAAGVIAMGCEAGDGTSSNEPAGSNRIGVTEHPAAGGGNNGAVIGINSSGGGGECASACRDVAEVCNQPLWDLDGDLLSQSDCTDICDAQDLAYCVQQCGVGTPANGACADVAYCVDECVTGGL